MPQLDFMQHIKGKGYKLGIDNFFSTHVYKNLLLWENLIKQKRYTTRVRCKETETTKGITWKGDIMENKL